MPAGRDQPRVHGALVWYRDTEALERSIHALAEQTSSLASLTVVDNRGGRGDLAQGVAAPLGIPVTYLDPGTNTGPAGGWGLAMDHVVGHAADDDWILLLDDDNVAGKPPELLAELSAFACEAFARDPSVGSVGRRGMRLHRGLGMFVPVPRRDTEGDEVDVDGVPSNLFPLYRVGALRVAGGMAPELFFGHEELDIGLRLERHGFRVVAWAPRFGNHFRSFGPTVRQRPRFMSETTSWRRYYSRRNLLVILRTNRLWRAWLFQLVVAPWIGMARLAIWAPRAVPAYARVAGRATVDALRGRMGRVLDPPGYA